VSSFAGLGNSHRFRPRFLHRTGARLLHVSVLSVALGLLGFQPAQAQSIAEEGGYRLTLQGIPDIDHGKAAILQGEANANGHKFFIENLFITQPVTVVLMAANPAQPLTLNLSKHRYDESDRLGETGPSGAVSFDFRTQGELKIHVKPKNPDVDGTAHYFLIAWAGDDIQPDLAPPVVVESPASGGGGLSALWLLALVFVAGAATVVFINRRRTA
jgi:hypothetical protein